MGSVHAHTQMAESIKGSGSMGSMRVLGSYPIPRGRSSLECFAVGGNGEGDPSYRRTVGLMGFGTEIGLREVCILAMRMVILTLDLSMRISRSMGTVSINSRITQTVRASFKTMNSSVVQYTTETVRDTKDRRVITSGMVAASTTTMMEE